MPLPKNRGALDFEPLIAVIECVHVRWVAVVVEVRPTRVRVEDTTSW